MAETDSIRLLEEIRDLLKLMATPQLMERIRDDRTLIRQQVGKSSKRRAAVLLIDGIRTRAQVQRDAKIDQGDLSRLITALKRAEVVNEEEGVPTLRVEVDEAMFSEETS